MPVTPERAKLNRLRKREEFLGSFAKLVGCSALVFIVAAVFYTVVQNVILQRKPLDADYLEAVYGGETTQVTWSRDASQIPAQMSLRGSQPLPKSAAGSSSRDHALVEKINSPADGSVPRAAAAFRGIANIEAKRTLIEDAVRGFFAADTVEGKLPYIRDPERVTKLMRDYYGRETLAKPKWQSLGWTLPVDEPGFRFGYVQALFDDASPVSLVIEEMDNGSFRIDWESSVRYGELSWEDFLSLKPVQPKLLRVIASKAETLPTLGTVMPGEEIIEIKHPAADGAVFASFNKGDPRMAPLIQQMQQGNWKDVPLTLRLCYPGPAADGKSVRIAGIEGKGWLILQQTRS